MKRVRVAAWTDLFMMGERFAAVMRFKDGKVHVVGERSNRKFWLPEDGVEPLKEGDAR